MNWGRSKSSLDHRDGNGTPKSKGWSFNDVLLNNDLKTSCLVTNKKIISFAHKSRVRNWDKPHREGVNYAPWCLRSQLGSFWCFGAGTPGPSFPTAPCFSLLTAFPNGAPEHPQSMAASVMSDFLHGGQGSKRSGWKRQGFFWPSLRSPRMSRLPHSIS